MSLQALNDTFDDQRPIRVAIANDYPLVIAGLARALETYARWVTVVEYDSQTRVQRDVGVVLFDAFGQAPGVEAARMNVLRESTAKVLIFTWLTDPDVVAASMKIGAAGVVSKTATADEVVDALQRVHRGGQVTPEADPPEREAFGRWPGDNFGVTSRESEVLALICQGLSNKQVGESMFLSANTVKSYIRSLYRRIGAQTRAQAVVWGMSNGFTPQKMRVHPEVGDTRHHTQ